MVKKSETIREAARSTRKRGKTNPRKTQPPRLTISDEALYERVARKAYELYQQRGEEHGRDLDDWLTAERLVQEELLHGPLPEESVLEEG
ncbi:MAG: DUF2934 domain-containing protein [Deltaproteobacteria bacterium]|nr:DUF2934 domain-containing protein [Deltaproteobacteria bacterium]